MYKSCENYKLFFVSGKWVAGENQAEKSLRFCQKKGQITASNAQWFAGKSDVASGIKRHHKNKKFRFTNIPAMNWYREWVVSYGIYKAINLLPVVCSVEVTYCGLFVVLDFVLEEVSYLYSCHNFEINLKAITPQEKKEKKKTTHCRLLFYICILVTLFCEQKELKPVVSKERYETFSSPEQKATGQLIG